MLEEKGYLIVASTKSFYYSSALNLICSIKEQDPDTPICLVTEERFLDKGSEIVDHIILCKNHRREKIWGMAKTPFKKTLYIDADCEVVHEDIVTAFDKFDGKDILFTELTPDRSYIYREYYWGSQKNRFTYCGGVCLYDIEVPLVKNFIDDWYDLTVKQYNNLWWPEDLNIYPPSLKRWDQFTLWWLTNKEEKYKNLKIGILDNEYDCRWNFYYSYDPSKNHTLGKDPIIMHYSNASVKVELTSK